MRAEINDWKNGWFGIALGLTAKDIDLLILKLRSIRDDPDQHFHAMNVTEEGPVGDVEFYVCTEEEPQTLRLSGIALAPGDSVLSPKKPG